MNIISANEEKELDKKEDLRKKLFESFCDLDQSVLCKVFLHNETSDLWDSITLNCGDIRIVILTALTYERYVTGNIDLLTLYKNMKVYDNLINNRDEYDLENIDRLIELMSIDFISLSIKTGEWKIIACNTQRIEISIY